MAEDDDSVDEAAEGDPIQVPYEKRNKERWSTPKEGIEMMKSYKITSNLTPEQEAANIKHDEAIARARQVKDD